MPIKKDKADEITKPLKEPPMPGKAENGPGEVVLVSLTNASALLDAVAAISAPLELRAVAKEAARQIALFANADICAISRWDSIENEITLWAEYRQAAPSATSTLHLPYSASDYPLTEEVLRSLKPRQLQMNDPTLDEGERILMKGMQARSLLMLPLMAQDKTFGLIELFDKKQSREFTKDEIAGIQVLAKHVGISLERALLLAEAKQRVAELEIIRQASLNLTASLDKQKVFHAVLESALMLSPDALDAHIFTYQDGKLTFGASLWANGKKGPAWQKARKGGLTDTVATHGDTIVVEDVTTHPLYKGTDWTQEGWAGSIIGLPLKIRKQVVGVMNIAYKSKQEFGEEKLRLLGLLSDQAAIAILNARLHDMAKLQATTDALTGLFNRRAFNDRLDEELRRSERYHHKFTLLILDLDGFKRVNDSYGHIVGDRTLKSVASCFQSAVRDTDFLARIGGDEFALILPETDLRQAKNIENKVSAALLNCQLPWIQSEAPFRISVSIGYALYPDHADNADGLISYADADLYATKKKRAGQVPDLKTSQPFSEK